MATLVTPHNYTGDIALASNSKPLQLPFDLILGDGNSHRFNITVKNNGEDVSLSGATCFLKAFRTADGGTPSISADVDGSAISAVLGPECTAYAGPVYIYVTVTIGSIDRTVWYATTRVRGDDLSVVVDPGSAVPSLGELLAMVADLEQLESDLEDAEALRVSAEEARETAEGQRDTAEGLRDTAETDRETAETARAVWEAYNAGTAYSQGNKVYYLGASYIWDSATPSTPGTAPPSGSWLKIADKGDAGEPGPAFAILGTYADLAALRTAVPSPTIGDCYNVGASAPYTIYRATDEESPDDWEDQGTLQATTDAADMDIADSGDYYTSGNVEGALQEIGLNKASKDAASTTSAGLAPQASAPASGRRNVLGIDNGETAYTNKALFDAINPVTQAFGNAAAVGTAMTAARRDHKHAMPAAQTLSSLGAQAKATITENTNAAPALGTLANNTEYRCTHSTPTDAPSMTIAAIAANTTEFACNVIYLAESTSPSAPAVTNNSGKTIKYQGDDVATGTFTPVADTVYRLGWVWDGIYLNCYIKGV